MKSFQQFITEAELHDREGLGHGTGLTHRAGEKIGRERKKTEPEKKRTKWVDGKKVATSYKPRKDIGTQRPTSTRVQQPEKERGSAALSAKEAQKKAYLERKALYKKGERLLRDIRLKNLGKKSEKELKHKITSK